MKNNQNEEKIEVTQPSKRRKLNEMSETELKSVYQAIYSEVEKLVASDVKKLEIPENKSSRDSREKEEEQARNDNAALARHKEALLEKRNTEKALLLRSNNIYVRSGISKSR
ncbi:MAG: hypothetical protein EOP34_06590 [Rickettsiales bacterium]|nr:MAG: hypothetical protein EOP34_06590 [Rickettsiales bacterium]